MPLSWSALGWSQVPLSRSELGWSQVPLSQTELEWRQVTLRGKLGWSDLSLSRTVLGYLNLNHDDREYTMGVPWHCLEKHGNHGDLKKINMLMNLIRIIRPLFHRSMNLFHAFCALVALSLKHTL